MAEPIEIPPVYPGDWCFGAFTEEALDAAEIEIVSGPHPISRAESDRLAAILEGEDG